ncbi:ADP-ribosylglycohydrolase family protein [Pseudomonas sp. GXZC]|uniref:ADP-ribosylglycohydrolase family protein n=1 Tax=Pseudomonas sp. GXZC TaxID=3003351 RepID=UPI0022AA7C5A|nr:ADP-ribosylglycohydrolase family protein [Pseudomonas sp. GXZC]WAT32238.1 ADP-ribosylglycohydrolase family protein [Pseudomonas sp. GXZC]
MSKHTGDISKAPRPESVEAELPKVGPGRSDLYLDALIGTAMGDSLGLPFENLSKRRVRVLVRGRLTQRFFGGFGMISDDTEHALLTARALMDSRSDAQLFERHLSRRLKRWLLALPPGVGKATLLSIITMCFRSPVKSGRPSAGNGPLMRAPIIGLYHAGDPVTRDAFVVASTGMTHTDPRALFMSAAVADICAASIAGRLSWLQMSDLFRKAAYRHATPESQDHLAELENLLCALDYEDAEGSSTESALDVIGCSSGIDGYVYRTALASAFVASRARSARHATEDVIFQGGDTDSTAALTAAMCAASGLSFPRRDIGTIRDWPVSHAYLELHARGLSERQPCTILEPNYVLQVIRNIALFFIVVGHVGRRMLPPYWS